MLRVSSELNNEYWDPDAVGPVAQADLTALVGAPATIAASGSFSTGILYADGHKAIAVGATLNKAGSISIQRYIDAAGAIFQGPALTVALGAGTPGVLNAIDGVPFQAFSVTITNGAAAVAALTNFGLLLNAS